MATRHNRFLVAFPSARRATSSLLWATRVRGRGDDPPRILPITPPLSESGDSGRGRVGPLGPSFHNVGTTRPERCPAGSVSFPADSLPTTPELRRRPRGHESQPADNFRLVASGPASRNGTQGPSDRRIESVTLRGLIHVLVARGAHGIVRQHRTGAHAVSKALTRAALAAAAGIASATMVVASATTAGASGIVPPSNPSVSVPPQVVPRCSVSPVNDTSAGCIDSVLHNINYA